MAVVRPESFAENYKIVFDLWRQSKARLEAHLDCEFLTEHAVDVSALELEDRVDQESLYYHPMTQSKLYALGETRPELDMEYFWEESEYCNGGESTQILRDFYLQIEATQGLDLLKENLTGWDWRSMTRTFERSLLEYFQPSAWKVDPTKQHNWKAYGLMESPYQPHQICLSDHEINNVTGLVRSELVILTSLMLAKMRRTKINPYKTYPVLLLSVFGRSARILHAHLCPIQKRLVIRCSRFYNFTNASQELVDLFVRWLLSKPLSIEPNETKEDSDEKCSDSGDTAPQIKAAAPAPTPAPIAVPAAATCLQLRTGASVLEVGHEQTHDGGLWPSVGLAA